jgi:hypothetical protein
MRELNTKEFEEASSTGLRLGSSDLMSTTFGKAHPYSLEALIFGHGRISTPDKT